MKHAEHAYVSIIMYIEQYSSFNLFTVVGQLPETSVIQNAPNQKSIIDHTLGNILENAFEKLLKLYQNEF